VGGFKISGQIFQTQSKQQMDFNQTGWQKKPLKKRA
jgi:hypothetical protein